MNAKIPFVTIRQIRLRVNASGVKNQNHQRVTMSPNSAPPPIVTLSLFQCNFGCWQIHSRFDIWRLNHKY